MQKVVKIPLVFLLIASLIGLALRWYYYQPIPAFNFAFWLHAHSHVMFLGWMFNAISMAFVICFISPSLHQWYKKIFFLINILVLGMLIAFPLQGYGVGSIAVSTIHTLVVIGFCIRFFRDTDNQPDIAVWFARTSLVFYLISAIGPFVVGALSANGLGQSDWYHLAVYYYLHFQYNGVFTFGIFALLFHLFEEKGIIFELKHASRFRMLLFVSCFPAYSLSTLWTNPPLIVNFLGLMAALTQLVALYYFLRSISCSWSKARESISKPSKILLMASLLALVTKLVLQLFSVYPQIATLAYETRYYVIAYLHLVLIGMISFFLIAWYREKNLIPLKGLYVYLLLLGFASSELVMIGVGQWPDSFNVSKWMVITSSILVTGITGIIYDCLFGRKATVLY